MGCCWGKEDDDGNQNSGGEIERLLQDPSSMQEGPSGQPITNYSSCGPPSQQKGDEQSALERILQRTASDMVDAAALDSHHMEHPEYMDRARQYGSRLSSGFSHSQRLHSTFSLPVGVAAPQVVLSGQPVSLADIQFISTAAQQMSRAVNEIKVKHKEDLVVPFGVP